MKRNENSEGRDESVMASEDSGEGARRPGGTHASEDFARDRRERRARREGGTASDPRRSIDCRGRFLYASVIILQRVRFRRPNVEAFVLPVDIVARRVTEVTSLFLVVAI